MTIDEAIEIYEKRAKSIERSFSRGAWADGGHKTSLMEVAADHRQLAEWLTELKEHRAADVQPIRRGHWIEVSPKHSQCSCCEVTCLIAVYPISAHANFCPNCGADMREPEAIKG